MSKFKEGIFDLTPEQESMSKMFYEGKIIKFIIAPHSTYADLEAMVPYTKTTFLFPEREMNTQQIKGFVSMIVKLDTQEEIVVFTKEQSIILDMIDGCARVMDYKGELHDCPCKTMMANIHTIQYKILCNEKFAAPEGYQEAMRDQINGFITAINNKSDANEQFEINEYNALKMKIEIIGEKFIRVKLLEQLRDVGYKGQTTDNRINFLQGEIDKLKALRDG